MTDLLFMRSRPFDPRTFMMNVFRKWQEKRKRKRHEKTLSQPTAGAPIPHSVPVCDDVPEQKIDNPAHDIPETKQPSVPAIDDRPASLTTCDPSNKEPTPQTQDNTRYGVAQIQPPRFVANLDDGISLKRPPTEVERIPYGEKKQLDDLGAQDIGQVSTCYRCLRSLTTNSSSPDRCACGISHTEALSSAPDPVGPTSSKTAEPKSLQCENVSSKLDKKERKPANSEGTPLKTSDNEKTVLVQTWISSLQTEVSGKDAVFNRERQAIQASVPNSLNTALPEAEPLWAQFYGSSTSPPSTLGQPDVKNRSDESETPKKQAEVKHIPPKPIFKLHNYAIALIVDVLDYTSAVFLKLSCKYFYERVRIPSTTPSNKDKFEILHTFAPHGSAKMVLCHLCQKWHRKNCYPSVQWSSYLCVDGEYRNFGLYLLCKGGTTPLEDGTKCSSCRSRAKTHMPRQAKELFGTRQPCPWCTEPAISIEWSVCCVDCFKEERAKSIDGAAPRITSPGTTAHRPTATQSERSNLSPSAKEAYVAARSLRVGKAPQDRAPPWASQGYPTSSAYQSTTTNEMRSWGIIPTRDSQRMRGFGKSSGHTTSYGSQGWGMGYSSTCGRCLGSFNANPGLRNMCLCRK